MTDQWPDITRMIVDRWMGLLMRCATGPHEMRTDETVGVFCAGAKGTRWSDGGRHPWLSSSKGDDRGRDVINCRQRLMIRNPRDRKITLTF